METDLREFRLMKQYHRQELVVDPATLYGLFHRLVQPQMAGQRLNSKSPNLNRS